MGENKQTGNHSDAVTIQNENNRISSGGDVDLKKKGTDVEEETGVWHKMNIPLPERSSGIFRYLRDFFTCMEFLTRIRITKREKWFDDDFARSVPFFPIVGMITGILMCTAHWLAGQMGLPGILKGVFLLLAELVFVGTLLYDGFMDTCDGIFSGRTRARKLEIMQDSHVGANAVIGAIILLMAKAGLLSNNSDMRLLIAVYIMTRTMMVFYILHFPNARPGGLGEMFKQGGSGWYSIIAFAMALAMLFYLGIDYCIVSSITAVLVLTVALYIKGQLGGLTGDTFGFLTECGVLLMFLVAFLWFNKAV